jgi:hypothetical protein
MFLPGSWPLLRNRLVRLFVPLRGPARSEWSGFCARSRRRFIHTPAGLDAFIDHLDSGSEIILADMGPVPDR